MNFAKWFNKLYEPIQAFLIIFSFISIGILSIWVIVWAFEILPWPHFGGIVPSILEDK